MLVFVVLSGLGYSFYVKGQWALTLALVAVAVLNLIAGIVVLKRWSKKKAHPEPSEPKA